jgi:hypothetical protein
VTEAWAECAGRSVGELRDAITAWRTNAECKNGIDKHMSKVIDDLKDGVERWRQETEYRKKPVDLRQVEKYRNRSELASYLAGSLAEFGLDVLLPVSRYPDSLAFTARFTDAFGHRVTVSGQVKFGYGGDLWTTLHFPYYDHERDPSQLSIERLSGLAICVFLGIDRPDCMIWTADHGKDAFPNIDGYLKILRTVCDYLRASALPTPNAHELAPGTT